ncbi:MAG: hypothetical protein LBC44_02295 [Mycoplasmataceae bacterium]|nr:hypothetical protein [Mycoplasmataceae bacterium]
MQNRNTQTGNQIKDALNEALNLYDSIKEKNPETKNSIYKYYDGEKAIRKGGLMKNKIIVFSRRLPLVSFSKYIDNSFLFPRSNQVWALIRILVIWTVIVLFDLLAFSLSDINLFLLILEIFFGVTSPVIIYFICIIIFMEVFIRKKKINFYSILQKIKFNKENKEELRNLMKDNEILWEIFQVKYGKDRVLLFLCMSYHYYVNEENTVLEPNDISSLKAVFVVNIVFAVILDVISLCLWINNPSDFFSKPSIFFLACTGYLNLVAIQWAIFFTIIIKIKKYKFKEIPREKPESEHS